jgi:hypothetical protein
MDPYQTTGAHPIPHRIAAQPNAAKLAKRGHSMLSAGDLGNSAIRWVDFFSHRLNKSTRGRTLPGSLAIKQDSACTHARIGAGHANLIR